MMSYAEALSYAQKLDVLLIPYEKAKGMEVTRQAMESVLTGQSVGIFIGPEGGFEEAEIMQAQDVVVFRFLSENGFYGRKLRVLLFVDLDVLSWSAMIFYRKVTDKAVDSYNKEEGVLL